jgi:hypothetical protein
MSCNFQKQLITIVIAAVVTLEVFLAEVENGMWSNYCNVAAISQQEKIRWLLVVSATLTLPSSGAKTMCRLS